jgi:hypothetical protein
MGRSLGWYRVARDPENFYIIRYGTALRSTVPAQPRAERTFAASMIEGPGNSGSVTARGFPSTVQIGATFSKTGPFRREILQVKLRFVSSLG